MNASPLLAPSRLGRAAAELVDAVAGRDECVCLTGEAGAGKTAVLDRAARELSSRRIRCVRVAGPDEGGLSLPGLMAQIVGRADPGALTDDDLVAGFESLTEPGEGYGRVALLVDEAHGLLPAAVRYIQLACKSGPRLRVVLAGRPSLPTILAGEEFAPLRQRLARTLDLAAPADGLPGQFSAAQEPHPAEASAEPDWLAPARPMPAARRRAGPWVLAGLGLAASVALAVWAPWRDDAPLPPAAAREGASTPARAEPALAAVDPTPPGEASPAAAGVPGPAAAAEQAHPEAAPPPAAEAAVAGVVETVPEAPPASAELDEPRPTAAVADLPLEGVSPSAAQDAAPSAVSAAAVPAPGPDALARAGPSAPEGAEAPPPPVPAVAASLPVPPAPPQQPRAVRPARAPADYAAAVPAGRPDERRCRAIVLRVQLGEDPSDADRQFLRNGCRAR